MEKWEYKIKEIVMKQDAIKKVKGFWGAEMMLVPQNVSWDGDKMMTEAIKSTNELEEQFNNLGKENWELCGIVPITKSDKALPGSTNTEQVYFIFKRKI